MRPLKEKISITLDNDILSKVIVLAEREDRSVSQYINLVLKDFISKLPYDEDLEKSVIPRRYVVQTCKLFDD